MALASKKFLQKVPNKKSWIGTLKVGESRATSSGTVALLSGCGQLVRTPALVRTRHQKVALDVDGRTSVKHNLARPKQ